MLAKIETTELSDDQNGFKTWRRSGGGLARRFLVWEFYGKEGRALVLQENCSLCLLWELYIFYLRYTLMVSTIIPPSFPPFPQRVTLPGFTHCKFLCFPTIIVTNVNTDFTKLGVKFEMRVKHIPIGKAILNRLKSLWQSKWDFTLPWRE